MKVFIYGLMAFSLFNFLGCSSDKAYRFEGEPNFTISFKADGAFFTSKDLYVSMFEYMPNCKYRYLGTVEVSRNETKKITLPVNKSIGVASNYEQNGGWGNKRYRNVAYPFMQVFKRDTDYALEFEEDNGAIGRNFYQFPKGKKTEMSPVEFYKNCKDFDDVDDK